MERNSRRSVAACLRRLTAVLSTGIQQARPPPPFSICRKIVCSLQRSQPAIPAAPLPAAQGRQQRRDICTPINF
jgi:hypothetical protein